MYPYANGPAKIVRMWDDGHTGFPAGQLAVDGRPLRVGVVGGIAGEAVAGQEFGGAEEVGRILRVPVFAASDAEAAVEVFVEEKRVFGDVGLLAADVPDEDVVAVVNANGEVFGQDGFVPALGITPVDDSGFEAEVTIYINKFFHCFVPYRRQFFVRIPEVDEAVAEGRVRPGAEEAVLVGVAGGEAVGYNLAGGAVNGVEETGTFVVFRQVSGYF